MIKARFYIRKDDCNNDYRPVKWPIKYPYWCSAESSNSFVLVAYAEDENSIKELWPEAINADINGAIGIARKVVGDSFIGKIIDSGFVFNPVRINIL